MRPLKTILSFGFFVAMQTLSAQGNTYFTKSIKDFPTFQIGGIGGIDMCYRTLENKRNEASIDELIQYENQTQTVKFGYHAGIGFCINVSKHFGMETGIIYSNRGYETKLQEFIYAQYDPSMPTHGRSIYNYNYIDIPLKANFFAGKGKVRFYASVGVSTNVLVAQNETFVRKYEDGRKTYEVYKSDLPLQNVVFTGLVAAGIDIKFSQQLNLRVSPNFSHNIGRFIDRPVSGYLWTTGISADFYFGWN